MCASVLSTRTKFTPTSKHTFSNGWWAREQRAESGPGYYLFFICKNWGWMRQMCLTTSSSAFCVPPRSGTMMQFWQRRPARRWKPARGMIWASAGLKHKYAADEGHIGPPTKKRGWKRWICLTSLAQLQFCPCAGVALWCRGEQETPAARRPSQAQVRRGWW